jgi:formylglycine-generating enzyme required for sulfatase activity
VSCPPKGGASSSWPSSLRLAGRNYDQPDMRVAATGFRLARTLR